MNPDNVKLGFDALYGIGVAVGLGGPIVAYLQHRRHKGVDGATENEINARVSQITDQRFADQERLFEEKLDKVREDQDEDRALAKERYERQIDLERYVDKIPGFMRGVRAAWGGYTDDVTTAFNRLATIVDFEQHGIIVPIVPTLPEEPVLPPYRQRGQKR